MKALVLDGLTKVSVIVSIGLAVQPLLSHAAFVGLAGELVRVLMLTGTAAALVLGVGYVHHRLQWWRATRPTPLPPLDVTQFAVTHAAHPDMARQTFQEAQALVVDTATPPTTRDEQVRAALIEFAFTGNIAGFGWRAMCRYVGREDWRNCLSTMQSQNVLRPPDGPKAADWNKGWSYSRFRMAMKYQHLGVPFPADAVVPFINWRKTP